MKLSREHVVWGYRLFLNREPESEGAIEQKLRSATSVADLRRQFVGSREFHEQIDTVANFDATNIVIKEIAPGLRLFVDLADSHIGLNVISGSYEPDEREFILKVLKAGDMAIDIGANIGFFSMLMAERVGPTGHVCAFEPLPRNASLLEQSVAENDFQTRITVARAAIGDRPGSLELISPIFTNNWGGPYLRTGSAVVPPEHETTVVPVIKLDDHPLQRPVSFIKLDAEGAEMLALRGAKTLLQTDRPIVLAEINQKQLRMVSGCSAMEMIGEMRAAGYKCFRLTNNGLGEELTDHEGDEVINVAFAAPRLGEKEVQTLDLA
jgi:FkbM family methyltransferase